MSKNILPLSFFSVLGMVLFIFSTKNNATPSTTNTTSTLSATINGSLWTPITVSGSFSSGLVQIVGSAGISTFEVYITSTSPGTYQLNKSSKSMIAYIQIQPRNTYSSTSGSIVVTSYSNNIMIGTFQGYCLNSVTTQDSVSVTNGAFSVYIH